MRKVQDNGRRRCGARLMAPSRRGAMRNALAGSSLEDAFASEARAGCRLSGVSAIMGTNYNSATISADVPEELPFVLDSFSPSEALRYRLARSRAQAIAAGFLRPLSSATESHGPLSPFGAWRRVGACMAISMLSRRGDARL